MGRAIKGQHPSSQGWAPGVLPLCVCVCVFGGLSSFCIWVEGLCVVVVREGGEGGSGFFLIFCYTNVFHEPVKVFIAQSSLETQL